MPPTAEAPTLAQKRKTNQGIIAISNAEYQKHGCPHCNYKYGSSYVSGGGSAPVTCTNEECEKHFVVVADELDRATMGISKDGGITMGLRGAEIDKDADPNTIYPWVIPHPCPDQEAWVKQDPGPNEDGSENFRSRGIGLDSGACCFVTGQEFSCHIPNIAGYVSFKESGERVVAMFGEKGGAWLDYREYEPTYIQVKILCCEEQIHCLQKLHDLTVAAGGKITPAMIEEARSLKK